jgi:hypothetical protein
MSLPESAMSEGAAVRALSASTLPVPGALPLSGEFATVRRAHTRTGLHALVLAGLLALVPLVAYWPTTFHEFGLRDDYSNLREAHEEPGKVVGFCASHARPVYGWLLQSSYGLTSSVRSLQWMRLASALLLGALAYVVCRGLMALGWAFGESLVVALLLTLLPSTQVMASWAIGWPYVLTALFATGAFLLAEGAFANLATVSRPQRYAGLRAALVALALMVLCALTYQSSALFYLVPLAAGLIAQRGRSPGATLRWAANHVLLAGSALAIAYAIMLVLYQHGVFVKSPRVAFEHHWGAKLAWFLDEPLMNALSLFALNDDHQRERALFLLGAAASALVLGAGVVLEWRRHGRARGLLWLAGLVILPALAFSISLVASERYATYRTILAMSAVLLCFLVASMHALTVRWSAGARSALATGTLALAFLTAQHHTYALIAVPQGHEWQLIVDGAKQVRLKPGTRPRVFAIASTPADLSTRSIYHDEFGSLSSNSEWVPKEMFKRAMHDLHRDLPDIDTRYEFATGPKLPAGQHFDVVIDLHRLRRFYLDT